MPPFVQQTYGEIQPIALPGMLADSKYDADTRTCESAGGIGFGVACGQGAQDRGVLLGSAAATGFVGISIKDITLVNVTPDRYAQYDNLAVMTQGDIWVTVGGNVNAGQDVTFTNTTGVLSSAAASGTQFAIAGARWMTSATNGQLALLRLGGALPSA